MAKQRVVIIGGGLAGLSAAMKLAELEIPVDLVSLVPARRSHSVCAQGGINSVNQVTRQLGDSEWKHFDDTVYGGDFLNEQPPAKEMCYWAPRVVDLLDRIGVTFNRLPEGDRDVRRFGGTLYPRTAFAGATTGQQMLYGLDEQARRWEAAGLVTRHEFCDFLAPVLDNKGVCRGAVIQDLYSMKIRSLPADAVMLASGGLGVIFGKSTNSTICTGSVAARVYRLGAKLGNPEFIQVHPTAIPGTDKHRLMSESARGEGGRVWVPRKKGDTRPPEQIPESERWYFLEEKYPTYGNLVPRDIATREIFWVCREGYSVSPINFAAYLDLTHLPAERIEKLEGILEIYEKFVGVDPRKVPMQIFPAVHYSMGGLWCDYEKDKKTGGLVIGSPRNQATNIPGLYAIGEADYQYHGANRLGANSLLSCIFAGLVCAEGMPALLKNLPHGSASDLAPDFFDQQVQKHREEYGRLLKRSGPVNPFELHMELGVEMTKYCTVVRHNNELRQLLDELAEMTDRYGKIGLPDSGNWTNQTVRFVRELDDMLVLARAIAQGALQRDECRGAHYKPEFAIPSPTADDPVELHRQAEEYCRTFKAQTDKWLKTTIVEYTPEGPILSYEPVDTSLIPPRPRTYGLKGAGVIERVWRETQARTAVASGE
jgi:succinate dehydrogenase / fumarate reductase flavoprotein subunit